MDILGHEIEGKINYLLACLGIMYCTICWKFFISSTNSKVILDKIIK